MIKTAPILRYLKTQPNDSIDLGITSPPYNKQEKNKGGLVKNIVYKKFRDIMNENDYQDWQVKVLDELYRVIKPGGHFFYNHRVRYHNGRAIHPLQ
jgi:modification methylase